MPLFMTSLDDADEDNEQLQALRALAYEGTKAEVADNFRTQGNECVKTKQWRDARDFYSKAIQALKAPEPGNVPADVQVVEIDEESERKKEREIEEACYSNRSLCELNLSNYGSCQRDCAAALRLNPRNVKAWYRAASACLALDKMPEAEDACSRGLAVEPSNCALQSLLAKINKRRDHLAELEQTRRERDERSARDKATLQRALKQRNILVRDTKQAPDMEDAVMGLRDRADANSSLSFPTVLLYPMQAQSDFIKAFQEDESLAQHLKYILPPPWDEGHEYTSQSVDCYMETASGGLIKAGKNLSLLKLLEGGKVEVTDGLVKVNVVPRSKASQWIDDVKKRRGKT
ncbi:hypothetical protein BAUCODRAFT_24588 [Baudoinia panamericana UAMH 10762]|uniref:Cns1/TTC4 wheel domain-containing protein n=1 Tax=Baudoinia panamericana (strain UAMH 10762) TaxID=717646 RepID=M2N9R0_BAUPA|nr:uncharacterized protein BAUCODRAFT_24588 [Baudoinia panamericana UAMH 10762]EMC95540.1 hypothetical protein BAUCODRAFT_24588 [Baudoinia panamericana UAMH 10762]